VGTGEKPWLAVGAIDVVKELDGSSSAQGYLGVDDFLPSSVTPRPA
jgi:hypothetical protein